MTTNCIAIQPVLLKRWLLQVYFLLGINSLGFNSKKCATTPRRMAQCDYGKATHTYGSNMYVSIIRQRILWDTTLIENYFPHIYPKLTPPLFP